MPFGSLKVERMCRPGYLAPREQHSHCHEQFEQVRYSAPFALAGKTLWLRATDAAAL